MEDRQPNGYDHKGKGKAAPQPTQDHEEDAEVPKTGSLVDRITNSAVGLAGAMIDGTPSNATLAESLTGEKGQTSRASGSAQRVGESSVRFQHTAPSGPSFRGSQSQAHIAAEESAFAAFLDGTSELQPPESMSPLDTAWRVHAGAREGSAVPASGINMSSSVEEQQRRDGEAVVSLLAAGDEVIFPDEAEDDVMSPEERNNLRRALFGDTPSAAAVSPDQWDNVLNFIPAYLRSNDLRSREEGLALTGAQDRDAEWSNWVEQWSDVLTRYTNEVWGDLGALVEQARSELEQLESAKLDDAPPETKAIRRLQAILGHLRGQQGP